MEVSLLASEWDGLAQSKSLDPPRGCIEIAIFGNSDDAHLVGDWLSSQNLFLQDPTLIDLTATYQNPHKFPSLDFLGEDLSSEASEDEENIPALLINQPSRKVSKNSLQYVLDHIHGHDLQPVEPDGHLTISLFPHQKEAVDFMIRRETGQLTSSISLFKTHDDRNGKFLYSHVITGQPILQPLTGPFGGILADTMGLGKTISTLSTVVSTLDHAKEWAKKIVDNERSQRRRTKATLVILPNEALMDQWLDEISKKFEPGTFSPCRYHGGSRRCRVSSFEDFDIILTTYGIVKVEFGSKGSLIFQHHFFRIVLDEAHCIKGRSTRTHDATCNISAARRWCLTGTPIQNSLDDLGALVTFLRVPLLEERKSFRSHIINPAYSGREDCFENLRLLLGFICLRRNTSVGMLVQPTINLLKLDLATDERTAYGNILDFHDRAMDLHVSGKGPAEGSCTAFQALIKLRIFCNNGLYKDRDTTSPTDPFDVEEYFNFLRESKKARCTNCDNEVLFLMESELPDTAVFTQCLHLICGPCYKSTTVFNSSSSKQSKCLASEYSQLQDQNALVQLGPRVWNELSSIDQGASHTSDEVFSTKFRVLLSMIRSHAPQEKGIVFSAWTKSLKIVAMMLRKEEIRFVKVDGSMSNAQRQRAFESFKISNMVNILLITIGAGAVGLNLSIATQVHILEPSWNPMVEKQAIGRVVRLDQRNPVAITRYIMRNTVEENVVTRQDFKMRVAMNGFKPSLNETPYDQRGSDSDI
ncbi:helicase [Penicillium pulvis]|uniref:helicase n=1 Tax=Penicillium pulvis TaxID=1562058 RepID=UPI002549737A|nr:helicase [Penicillium pulvis]KAJ5797976.1 helicase [Penicillium pulvis]